MTSPSSQSSQSSASSATTTAADGAGTTIEGAVRLMQEHGARVLNAIDDGIYFLDRAGRSLFINEAGARMLGYTNREVIGKSMHQLTHHHFADGSDFPEESCPIMSSVTEGVQQRVGGDTFWTKSGEAIPVDYTSIPIKDGRTIVGAVVTFRDISDQQKVDAQAARLRSEREARAEAERTREALRASEERYRFLAESIPVQVWTAKPDGALDYVTRSVADYFGMSAERILGEGWQNVVHAEDLPAAGERWMHSLATGEPYEVQFRLRRHDGEFRWHLSRANAQRGDGGAIVQWFGSNTDIDDQKSVLPSQTA